MPIKTTLVTFSPLAFSSRAKDSTCSAISDGERTLLKPRCPVAQKEQSIWQPASVETHTVRLPSPCLMRTLSMARSSQVKNKFFPEPSSDFCSVLRMSSLKGRSRFKSCLNAMGIFSMASKPSFRSRYMASLICLKRYAGCPSSSKAVSYTHLRAHETRHDLVCRLLLEKKKKKKHK